MSEGLYEIEAVAGAGSHAVVCFARLRGRSQRVALKVLRSEYRHDAPLVARLADEARMLMSIRHPDIVRVHRLLDYDGRPVIEMEPVEGVSFDTLLADRDAGLPVADAVEVVRRVAVALHAAHSGPFGADGAPMRVVHRDVKPANVVLASDGGLKVVDFGLAKGEFVGRKAKSLAFVAGSSGYRPPERKQGVPDGPATDVFALGVTLFVLLTGRTFLVPTEGDHGAALARQLAHLPHQPIAPWVERMVALDPAARPSTDEVATGLARVLADAGLTPDLAALAASDVVPAVEKWRKRARRDEEDLAFLEATRPSGTPEPLTAEQANAAVRALLAKPGWERRVPELERVIDVAAGGFEEALLDVLDRAHVPWWTPWTRAASPDEIVAALWVLGDRPSPAVHDRARDLCDHPDDRVRRSARFVSARR